MDIRADVDKIFVRWTRTTPGCAVGADVKGKPVIRAAYGMADLEHDVPITPDTIFEAASVSKQFTAAAVLLLARENKLSLDDPARKYISELPESATSVTIRQMLQHTAGLRDWGYLSAMAGWPRGTRAHTDAHVLDILGRQRALNFTPGSHWSYSTSGYTLAAILVSRVSGMSLSDYTKKRIFEPLGMTNTSWRDDYSRIVKRRAVGYREQKGAFATDMPFEKVYGHGGLLTTVGDLLKWNQNFETPVVGDAAFVADLQRRAVLTDGRTHEYALGLYVDTHRGTREVDHSGGGLGYYSHLVRYPDQQVSVAVLCNVNSANPTASARAVAYMFLTGLRTPPPPAPSHTLSAAEAELLVGLYRSMQPVGIARVLYDNKGLRVQGVGPLIAMTETRFVTSDGSTYEFDRSGRLRTTDEFGLVTVYDRVEPANIPINQLKEYTGRYVSDEIETTFDVVLQGEHLFLRRRLDPPVALTAVFPDGFSLAGIWMVFRRDASGQVVAASVSGERMWDLPLRRELQTRTTAR